jgi:hypothetical protein
MRIIDIVAQMGFFIFFLLNATALTAGIVASFLIRQIREAL